MQLSLTMIKNPNFHWLTRVGHAAFLLFMSTSSNAIIVDLASAADSVQ